MSIKYNPAEDWRISGAKKIPNPNYPSAEEMARSLASIMETMPELLKTNINQSLSMYPPALVKEINNIGSKENTMPRTNSADRRKDWKLMQFNDLQTGDEVIFAPSVVKADQPVPDEPTTPIWGGQYGSLVGRVLSRDEDGERKIVFAHTDGDTEYRHWNVNTELISPCGMILKVHFDTLTSKEKTSFDTVIMPKDKKKAILDAIKQVDNHSLIFEEWGFGDTFEKGTAISLLFYGIPGTGKTLAAQAIADLYNYKLEIISTAEIETPEPGGAERNIQKAFRAAANGKTVLLFDECDSLVSSRKHMGAIMAAQVNVLLTELERYTGIVVFTTNRIETLDEAFDRRLSLKLEFEMPNAEQREKIWARMFPIKAPLADDVDFKELAEMEIAGGHIKNIVLKAARAAANQQIAKKDKKITQKILIDALTQEVESMVSFQDSKKSQPLYGSPQRGMAINGGEVHRERGRLGLGGGRG